MIVPSRVAPSLAILVALLTVAIAYNMGIAQAPRQFFGEREDVMLILPGAGRLSTSATISETIADLLEQRDDVDAVSPEIVVLTSLEGRSIVARGVRPASFLELERAAIVEGRLPEGPAEALAGLGFLRATGMRLGDPLLLPAPLAEGGAPLRIVGVFEVDGPARDEILVPLLAARALANLPPDGVHLIRLETDNATGIDASVRSVTPRFAYSNVRLSSDRIVLGEPLRIEATLTNWGLVGGMKDVELRANGDVIASERMYVPARTSVPVSLPVLLRDAGEVELSLNPNFTVVVTRPRVALVPEPTALIAGEPVETVVVGPDGAGLPAARVRIAGSERVAGEDGRVVLLVHEPGEHRIDVLDADGLALTRAIHAARPEHRGRPVGEVVRVAPPEMLVRNGSLLELVASIRNVGSEGGPVEAPILIDGAPHAFTAHLAPGEVTKVIGSFGPFPVGVHEILMPTGVRVSFEVIDGDPAVEAAIRAHEYARLHGDSLPSAQETAGAYVARITRSVSVAVTVLSIFAGALASLAAAAVWGRHLAERGRAIGILKALGATRAQVQWIVTREAAAHAGIATIVGIAAGALIALGIDALGLIRAFGHVVHPAFDAYALSTLAIVSVFANALLARSIAGGLHSQEVHVLLSRENLEPPPPRRVAVDDLLAGAD